jgi:hypothetical protein
MGFFLQGQAAGHFISQQGEGFLAGSLIPPVQEMFAGRLFPGLNFARPAQVPEIPFDLPYRAQPFAFPTTKTKAAGPDKGFSPEHGGG